MPRSLLGGMIDGNAVKAETLLHFGTGGREVATNDDKMERRTIQNIYGVRRGPGRGITCNAAATAACASISMDIHPCFSAR